MGDRVALLAGKRLVTGEVVEQQRLLPSRELAAQRGRGSGMVAAGSECVRPSLRLPHGPDRDEPPQLGDRLRMVLDAQVADTIDALSGLGTRAGTLDDDRRRLLATPVAARGLACLERR